MEIRGQMGASTGLIRDCSLARMDHGWGAMENEKREREREEGRERSRVLALETKNMWDKEWKVDIEEWGGSRQWWKTAAECVMIIETEKRCRKWTKKQHVFTEFLFFLLFWYCFTDLWCLKGALFRAHQQKLFPPRNATQRCNWSC